ncbi:ABC transporter permease [Pseudonocardia nigra]|uniref:ABC transporter permease n=1 Tax=Pseudonocardia nigra TaxID=1921578 RepID=UPI0027E38925|nr:ABC transporter permease subunit [Pseudonocardia nigra]
MNLVLELVEWFGDATHWTGSSGVPARLADHLRYTVQAIVIAAVIAIPLGAVIGHTRRGGFLVVGSANGLRALPELGLLTLLVGFTGLGVLPLTITLVILAVPPLLAGTYAGVRNADAAVIDAARGVGMREREVLTKVELPIAVPLILGGLRTATLQVIATATIGAYIGLSGLGRFLIDGLALRDYTQMVAGAVLVAALALLVEGLLGGLQRTIVSPGLHPAGARRRAPRQAPVFAGGTTP